MAVAADRVLAVGTTSDVNPCRNHGPVRTTYPTNGWMNDPQGFTVVDGGTATLRVLPAVPLSWRDAEEDDDVEGAVNEILYKVLWKRLVDTRTLPGVHDGVDGLEQQRVVAISIAMRSRGFVAALLVGNRSVRRCR